MGMLTGSLIFMSLVSSAPSKEGKEPQNKDSFLCEILDNSKKVVEPNRNRSSSTNGVGAERDEATATNHDSRSEGMPQNSKKVAPTLNLGFEERVTYSLKDTRYYVQLANYLEDYQILVKRRGTLETIAVAKTPQKTFSKLSLGVGTPQVTINCPPLSFDK
ncbi:MAG: hypothetical protein H7318_19860 [Oligoflexus sp.]|nr:hypothetical protein [Oligoflexus sp.]